MAISDSQKVDILWKKTVFGVTNTSIGGKEAQNETIPSPTVVDSRFVWGEASLIPETPPGTSDTVIDVRQAGAAVQMIPDPTVPGNRSWIAVIDTNGSTTDPANRLGNWVPPSFGPGYLLQVYTNNTVNPSNSLNSLSNNQEWQFDYVAGTLQFLNNIPSLGSGITIEGYRYVGAVGGSGSGGGGLDNVVEDLTPELGGDLDVNGYKITSNTGEIILSAGDPLADSIIKADDGENLNLEGGDGGGRVAIHGYSFPNTVGGTGEVLVLDNTNNLQWAPLPSGTLPFGTELGQVLTWTAAGWTPLQPSLDNELPDGVRVDDVLTWDGSQWVSRSLPPSSGTFSGEWNDILNKPSTFPTTWAQVASVPQEVLDLVNGVLPDHSHTSDDLTDFPASKTSGEFLMWDGTSWITAVPATGTGGSGGSGNPILDWPNGTAVGDYWRWNGGAWVTAAFPAIPDVLNDLSDVSTAGATTGEVLTYNGLAWEAAPAASNITALNDIPDVNVAGVTDGQVLSYNSGTGQWVASTVSGGSGSGINDIIEDTSPQLGGDLDLNGNAVAGFEFTDPANPNLGQGQFLITTGTGREVVLSNQSRSIGQVMKWVGGSSPDGTGFDSQFVAYSELTGVPSTFPTQISQINDFPTATTSGDVMTWNGSTWVASPVSGTFSGAYGDLTGVPTEFNPSAHGHLWSEVTGKPTITASGGNVTGTLNLSTGSLTLNAPAGGGGAQYEWAVFQYQSGFTLNQASTQHSAGLTITYEDTSAANIVGFTFSGYNVPPAGVVVYAQNMVTQQWRIQDWNAFVDTPARASDANGNTVTPDLLDFGSAFDGKVTMGLSFPNMDANNLNGLPTFYAQVLVLFSMVG